MAPAQACAFSRIQKPPKLKSWKEEYSQCAQSLIQENDIFKTLTQAQVGQACPKYSTLSEEDKQLFIPTYIQEWAYVESGGRHDLKRTINAPEGDSIEKGLFSFTDNDREYCGVARNQDLLDPVVSIKCAVNVMDQMIQNSYPLVPQTRVFLSLSKAGINLSPKFLKYETGRQKFLSQMRIALPQCF